MNKERYRNLNMRFSARTDVQTWLLRDHFLWSLQWGSPAWWDTASSIPPGLLDQQCESGDTELCPPCSDHVRPEADEKSQFKHQHTQASLSSPQRAPPPAEHIGAGQCTDSRADLLNPPPPGSTFAHPFLVSCSTQSETATTGVGWKTWQQVY